MTNAENNQLIADVARDIIAQTAPQELPLFRATSAAYFKHPDKVLKDQTSKDEMLGFGPDEAVALLTPYVLLVMTEAVTFIVNEVKKSVTDESAAVISDLVKKQFKRFRSKEKKEQHEVVLLTPEQIEQVHKQVYEKAHQLKLSDDKAGLLADAVVGSLVSEAS